MYELSRDLDLNLRSGEREAIDQPETRVVEAYEAYVKGQALAFTGTPEGIEQAIQLAERAIELDPAYAHAYAGWQMFKFDRDADDAWLLRQAKLAGSRLLTFAGLLCLLLLHHLRPMLRGLQRDFMLPVGMLRGLIEHQLQPRLLGGQHRLRVALIELGLLDDELRLFLQRGNLLARFGFHRGSLQFGVLLDGATLHRDVARHS